MAFPITPILDDFNRANENPLANGTWTTSVLAFDGPLAIVSNKVRGGTGSFSQNGSWWSASTFGPDCEVYATLDVTAASQPNYLFARLQAPGTTGVDGYALRMNTFSNNYSICRIDNNTITQLGATQTFTPSTGNRMGLEIIGSTLTVYINVGGGWVAQYAQNDATYSAAGAIGAGINDNLGINLDNFGGGTIPSDEPSFSFPTVRRRSRGTSW